MPILSLFKQDFLESCDLELILLLSVTKCWGTAGMCHVVLGIIPRDSLMPDKQSIDRIISVFSLNTVSKEGIRTSGKELA